MNYRAFSRLAVLASLCLAADSSVALESFDCVIAGGRIIDGTGAPWYVADIGLKDGKIARIGRLADAPTQRRINATGLVVAPGFIDMMGQSASPMLDDRKAALNLITQGITTINAGEGYSAAPIQGEAARSEGWSTMAEYFQVLELGGLTVNVAQTVGHTQVRELVMGEADRKPTTEELERMKDLVREAMEAGAIGVSTALIYPPAVYADTDEIGALAAVAGAYGGRYYTHMRNEGDRLLEAIDEALEIGRKGGTPVHIFHLKAAGRANWSKMEEAVAKIKAARAAGQEVAADMYPYVNNGLGIAALIHPRHFAAGRDAFMAKIDDVELRATIRAEMESDDGDWENWYKHLGRDWEKLVVGRANGIRFRGQSGKSLAAIAEALKAEPWDVFFELVKNEAFVLPETMSEENKRRLIGEGFISFCTDVGPVGGGSYASHPRASGAFPRLLAKYVRDGGVSSLERVVAQASALAANEIAAYDRGRIAEGLAGDIIVFDEAKLIDSADFANPQALSEGMRFVFVNGDLVLDEGKATANLPGRILRGPGFRREAAASSVETGREVPELAAVDALMHAFMARQAIPGASVAITDGGRLVYARGFGYADLAAGEKATAESLFRIASISKPVTSAAVFHMIEEGKLALDDRIFDILTGYEPPSKDAKIDERLATITVRNLLQHSGGWDREKSFDAMFRPVDFANALGIPAPAGQDAIIRNMMAQPLDFDPGARQAYSNFGYCLLGRALAKLSGLEYDAYVKRCILDPAGARTMVQGRSFPEQRQPNEVRYYSPDRGPSVFADSLGRRVPFPYGGWNLEAMDSHGAWLASAVDLARFAVSFDDNGQGRLLKPESLAAVFARPPGGTALDKGGNPNDPCYAAGWKRTESDEGPVFSHSGSLTGSSTLLVKRPDGRNWIVLFNARSGPRSSFFPGSLQGDLDRVLDAVPTWPSHDLFQEFKNHQPAPALKE